MVIGVEITIFQGSPPGEKRTCIPSPSMCRGQWHSIPLPESMPRAWQSPYDPPAGPASSGTLLTDRSPRGSQVDMAGLSYLSGSKTVWIDSISSPEQYANVSTEYFPDGNGDWIELNLSLPQPKPQYAEYPDQQSRWIHG